MRYCPVLSLTAARTFSMSAGLLASTVTPGSIAPDVSLTVPAMTAWAAAVVGRSARKTQTARDPTKLRIWHLHVLVDNRPREKWRKATLLPGEDQPKLTTRRMTFPVLIPLGRWR